MPTTCVIVDDEYLAVNVLQEYAARIHNLEVKKSFINPSEALHWLQQEPVDILFLDIQMPYLDGFSLLQQLKNPPMVIFTTARHDYAVKAFELDVLDYLVKPVSFERFELAVNRALEYQALKNRDIKPTDALMVKSGHRIHKVLFADILFIEGLNEYVKIHSTTATLITLASLKDLAAQLPADRFIRIHKSYIANRTSVKAFTSSKLLLTNGKELPVGRVYKEEVMKWLGKD